MLKILNHMFNHIPEVRRLKAEAERLQCELSKQKDAYLKLDLLFQQNYVSGFSHPDFVDLREENIRLKTAMCKLRSEYGNVRARQATREDNVGEFLFYSKSMNYWKMRALYSAQGLRNVRRKRNEI